jgi:hypothetical protein
MIPIATRLISAVIVETLADIASEIQCYCREPISVY